MSPLTALRKQAGAVQILEMEGERRRKKSDTVGDATGVEPFRASANQQAKDREAMFVGQGSEGGDGLV